MIRDSEKGLFGTELVWKLDRFSCDRNDSAHYHRLQVITTQNERKIPVANGHTQAAWTAENGAYTESNPTFGQTSIDASS